MLEYLPMTLGECLEGKEPGKEIKNFQTKCSILLDVANGLVYLHQKQPPVIHRDLTAYNILLTSNFTAKITDLGVSKILATEEKLTAKPGNPNVMPPEARKDNAIYNHKIDVFSFGCLILHIIINQFPTPTAEEFIENPDDLKSFIKVTECNRSEKYIKQIPKDNELLPLAQHCLSDNPKERPEMLDIIHFIEGTEAVNLTKPSLDLIIRNAPDVHICGNKVPNCRRCPTCGCIVEHIPGGSKFVVCPRCKTEYCFLCLELREHCLREAPDSFYKKCSKDVAPRQ